MKAKISRGKGFKGALDYVCDEDKSAQVVGGNMSSDNATELSSEFKVSRALRPDCKKPVWHCSLSLPQGERLSDEKWQEITNDYMQRMGLDPANHQFVAVRHGDTEHDHVHIVASRIGLDSKLWHGQHDVRKAINACQELEQAHGLQLTPGLSMDENHKSSLKRGEIEMSLKTGEAPPKLVLQQAIDEALKDKPDTAQFIERLESAGITPRPNIASTGRMNGFSFEYEGVAFKASQLGKSYSWGQLQKRGLDYDQERDTDVLRAAKEAAEHGQSRSSEVTSDSAQQSDLSADSGTENATNAERRELGAADRAASAEPGGPERRGPGSDREHSQDSGRLPGQDSGEMERRSRELERHDRRIQDREREAGDSDRRLDRSSQASQEAEPGRVAESLDSSDQQQHVAGAGASQRVCDLAAPAFERREDSDQGLSHSGAEQQEPAVRDRQKPVAAHIKAKQHAWQQQHEALQAPAYRLTLKARRENLQTYNMGKSKTEGEPEKFYTAEEVQDLISQLSRQNARGYDIYITPIDDQQHYLVLDDSDPQRLQAMQQQFGIEPCLVQESSPGNLQAIIKAAKPEQSKTEQSLANRAVERLNQRYGDPKFTGVVHPFRMSGFMNQKPVYEQNNRRPIVRPRPSVVRLTQSQDKRCNEELKRYRQEQAEQEQKQRERREQEHRQARHERIEQFQKPSGTRIDAEQRYLIEAHKCVEFVKQKGWPLDYSRVDYHVCKQMLKDDYFSESQIENAVKSCSPNLYDRHNDVDDYAKRTVENASQDPEVVQHRERELELTGPSLG